MLSSLKEFPYGGAALALLILALGSGGYIAAHPVPKKTTTLTYWTFAKPHYESYLKALPEFERTHPGVTVDFQLVSGDATGQRLNAAFWSNLDVPDLAETEITNAGGFFRGSVKDIGFVDLTDRINREGWKDKMVSMRFSAYTTRGHIFGLPHDCHPIQIAYRKDIFDKEGIDLTKIQTWDEFVALGRKMTRTTGDHKRYMLELSDAGSTQFEELLFQRDGGYFDPDGHCIFDNETSIDMMKFYVPLVAGPGRIGNSVGWGTETDQAIDDGYILCYMTPDWRSRMFQDECAPAAGKMALMPLPAFTPDGRHTSTGGGTMVGITKHCKNPDLAWELAKFLYTHDQDLAQRFTSTNIVPPVRSAWSLPEFQKPNPFFSNQPLGKTYADLAPYIPPQYGSPFLSIAKSKLAEALVACVAYYNEHGDNGFDAFVRATLKEKADYVRLEMSRLPDFDGPQPPQVASQGVRVASK